MNKSKTEAVLLYKESNVKMNNSDINWSNKPFKTLGIWYSLNNIEMNEINVNEKTKNIESLLNLWSSRCLSLIGKVIVLKSLIMPHVLHIASVIHLSDDIVTCIEKMF